MNLELIRENKTEELNDLISKLGLTLVSFSKEQIPLPNSTGKFSWIPRCNVLYVEVENRTDQTIEELLLTVTRTKFKIHDENYDVVPIKTYGLKPNSQGKYELIVFDPFNASFESIELRVTNELDWKKRTKVENWLNRSGEFSKRID